MVERVSRLWPRPPPRGFSQTHRWPWQSAGPRCNTMADKSPRKQNKAKKLTTKEKQDKKKAKRASNESSPLVPKTGGPKKSD